MNICSGIKFYDQKMSDDENFILTALCILVMIGLFRLASSTNYITEYVNDSLLIVLDENKYFDCQQKILVSGFI